MGLGESTTDTQDNRNEAPHASAGDTPSPGENGTPAPPEEKPHTRLTFDLPSGEHIRITVECLDGQDGHGMPVASFDVLPNGELRNLTESSEIPVGMITQGISPAQPEARTTRSRLSWHSLIIALPTILFALSLLIYFSTRVIGLTRFPIYFFTDEAVQTMLAADLVRDNFVGGDKVFLPTYFKNGSYFNLGTSVYLQVLPYVLFGKSVFVTRLVSVLVSLLAAASVGLMLRDFYNTPYWWIGALLLSIAPAWFLHSRTAFETVIFVSLYAGMLYCYLAYRLRSPSWLYPTLILGALAFYSYSPGQVVVAFTGLLLLISDAAYHWKNRRTLLRGALVGVILALPYLRFRLEHPEAAVDQLRLLGSYLLEPIPLQEKLRRFGAEYLYGLSPGYWFIPNEHDLPRHLMKGYGHLLRFTLPFAFIGLLVTLSRLRHTQYRLLLITLLVGPLGSALVGIGITRVLVMVVPATLLIALGISWFLGWLESPADRLHAWRVKSVPTWLERWKLPQAALSLVLFAVLVAVNVFMLADSLRNGPTWYRDYGMGGMQYGAQQIFQTIREYLKEKPQTHIIFSPTWANGTDVLARFFLGDPLPIAVGSIEGHLENKLPLDENTLFITSPDEYQKILESGKFKNIRLESTLPYPDGSPGFHFVRLSYTDDIDRIFAAEREKRRELLSENLLLDGEQVQVRYPVLDIGDISLLFDGDPHTMLRTLEANPLVVELEFPEVREIHGISIIVGSASTQITAGLTSDPRARPVDFTTRYKGSVEAPEAALDFGLPVLAKTLRIELLDLTQQEPAHVHAWEIKLR